MQYVSIFMQHIGSNAHPLTLPLGNEIAHSVSKLLSYTFVLYGAVVKPRVEETILIFQIVD